jgi:hypothetical protein
MGTWSARYVGGGVRLSSSDDGVRRSGLDVTITDLRRHFDDRIIANLCRAFAGCDRLTSLAHLAKLTDEHLSDGSLARERNLHALFMLTFGTTRELVTVLDDLNQAGIKRALSDPEPWLKLKPIRKRWSRETAAHVRNRLAFHFSSTSLAILFAAAGIEDKDFFAVIERFYLDNAEKTWGLQAVAHDLLRQCGARY